MNKNEHETMVGMDRPLPVGSAIELDELDRDGFAQSAAAALRQVSATSGFVLSIEGAWGSGKTSTLAMIQDVLQRESTLPPVIVHFNPWLVGDRDALLRLFLAKIASSARVTEHAKNGQKVARELKAYSKAFGVLKLIPGAEPWASMVKTVVTAVADATGDVSEYKTPDLERQKSKVEEALQKFPRPIIVFIDDMDRLFPLEVFEMVRIVKAIGDLPNVGYVLAWDPGYITRALETASVPQSHTYLDKIVQVRMPLPGLSLHARETLINRSLKNLSPDATKTHFPHDEDRLSLLYFSGLRELLDQPRDFTRVFNTVAVIEPALRGEVVLSDIVGLATLMVKAPTVFELLRKQPRWFVGRLPPENGWPDKNEDIVKEGQSDRTAAYATCSLPNAVRRLVHHLFPLTAIDEDEFALNRIREVEGHLAAPTRLLVALQLSISPSDVSLVQARLYLLHPDARESIEQSLTLRNCQEFLEQLGDVARAIGGKDIADLDGLCLDIARLVDKAPFPERSESRSFVGMPAERLAIQTIEMIVRAVDQVRADNIAPLIIRDGRSLTTAVRLMVLSYLAENISDDDRFFAAAREEKEELIAAFSANALAASARGQLLATCNPGLILWNLSRLAPEVCPQVFEALREADPSLDDFALQILKHSIDSNNGQAYRPPEEDAVLEAYCPLSSLREQARSRLADASLDYPGRAAWQSLVEGRALYGKDGSSATR